jgi:GTP-binding protein
MNMLDKSAMSYQIIMTKADTVKPAELDANQRRFLGQISRRPAAFPEILVTSAETGRGIGELRDALAALAAQG